MQCWKNERKETSLVTYGTIPTSRTLVFAGSGPVVVAGQRRYAVNGVSFVVPDTPLKLLDNYSIADLIEWDSVPAGLPGRGRRWSGSTCMSLSRSCSRTQRMKCSPGMAS